MLQTGKQKLREVTLLTQIHQVVSGRVGIQIQVFQAPSPDLCTVSPGLPQNHSVQSLWAVLLLALMVQREGRGTYSPSFCFHFLFLPHALTAARVIHQKHTPCPSFLDTLQGLPFLRGLHSLLGNAARASGTQLHHTWLSSRLPTILHTSLPAVSQRWVSPPHFSEFSRTFFP